ncbi:MAG: tetratricopeptide repeat protein [Gemmatimonadetes bacterium]|nr:tetratricopeptide repeat protein [Gemmatimonadota bacterium]
MRGAAVGSTLALLALGWAGLASPAALEAREPAPVIQARSGADAAQVAFLAGQYDEAISQYAAAAARNPSSAAPLRGLIAALREVGRYDDAIAAAERFNRANPDSPELWNSLGEVLRLRGRRTEAEAAFNRAITGRASDNLTARLNLALLRRDRGDLAEARRTFDSFIDVYNNGVTTGRLSSSDLAAVASAVRYLSVYNPQLAKDAVRAYQEAIAADPTNIDAQVELGQALLEGYAGSEARSTFEEILAKNERHPRALLGMAQTLHFESSPEVEEPARRSLEINPNLTPARAFLARLALEREDYEEARREAERALEIDSTSLDALAVLAGVHYLQGNTAAFEEVSRRTRALNPVATGLYVTLADLSARSRQYDDAVRFAQQGVALDSAAWRAWAHLGVNQLRLGEMAAGRRSLETAFRGDPFDVWTKNTLDLLDDLDLYPETATARFRIYAHEKESALLGPYVGELAEQAYDALARRYGYRPATPIRIEVFPNHADFSVRTVGLVGLGALGVSFGPVIAMDSPSAREMGQFHWGSTLWHELSHTFHLGMSDHRVPRWFTEGLAVHEERRSHPGWGDDIAPDFLAAYSGGRLRNLRDLNEGFVRPAYPEQIGYSYQQASLVFALIERDFGAQAILDMLALYRREGPNADVFRGVLDMDIDAFERRFEQYMRERFGRAMAALGEGGARGERAGPPAPPQPPSREEVARRARNADDFAAQLAMGHLLFAEERFDEAMPYLERAKELYPEYAGPQNPYRLLARIHQRKGAPRAAAAELRTLTRLAARHYDAHIELADVLETLGDTAGAAEALDAALYVNPFDANVHNRLAALYESLERWDGVIRERMAVLGLDPVDRAGALYRVALAHFRAGHVQDARSWVIRALEIAPAFEEAQGLLLEIAGRGPR